MTILELLVIFATLAFLMSLLMPAVQAAREAGRNTQCIHHLHQIAVALHVYHDTHRALPAGWQPESSNVSCYGWAATILGELGEYSLLTRVNRGLPLDSMDDNVRSTTPRIFLCPSDSGDAVFPLYTEIEAHAALAQESMEVLIWLPRANYVGVFGTTDPDDVPGGSGNGVFVKLKAHRFADITRGLNHVVFVGERTMRKLSSTWLGVDTAGEDAAGRLVGYADLGPNRDDVDECEFDSRHPGHVNFAWADGHVSSIGDAIDGQVYSQLAKRRW